MQGLSPRPHTLTSRQIQISKEVVEALPDLPTTVSDMISQLAVPDFSLAAQPLELDKTGEPVDSPENRAIIACIELALTSSTFECDPDIKSTIFANATEPGYHRKDYGQLRPYLAKIMNGLSTSGQQIILDDVVIKNMDMSYVGPINLSGMSAKRTIFENLDMDYFQMDDADLSGATFNGASLENATFNRANISDVTFRHVYFNNTPAGALTGNQMEIFKCHTTLAPSLQIGGPTPVSVQNTVLSGNAISAKPDTEIFTLPGQLTLTTHPAVS